MRALARRLMAYEAAAKSAHSASTFHVCEMLRPHLATLMGNAGYRALLSRSLALASAEMHWLRAVHVRSDGSLEGFDELASKLTPGDVVAGKTALLAQLLGLLETFIGGDLTTRVVREVWPRLSLGGLDRGKGDGK